MAAKTFRELSANATPALTRIIPTQAPTGSDEPEKSTLTQLQTALVTPAAVQALSADWRGEGSETLITATAALQSAIAAATGDPFTETTNATETSPYTLSGITGNHVHTITALDTDLTINKPTGTFTSDVRQWVIFDIVASAATRTLTLGTGINKAGGADLNLAIASGDRFILSLWTDDGGTTFYYDGDLAIASYPLVTMDPDNDHILVADAGDSDKPKRALLPSASASGKGIAELAIASEVDTGTDATRAITPDALAGSNFGRRVLALVGFESDAAVEVGDGTVGIPITTEVNGHNVLGVLATVHTKGVTGTTEIQIRRRRGGSDVDVLSTKVTIGDEWFAADGVVNTSNDDLQTGDVLYIDTDQVHSGTPPNGLSVAITTGLP